MQGSRLAATGKPWNKAFYLPASCDRFVASMRAWMDRVGGGGPTYAPGAWQAEAKDSSRRALLDRYEQHVKLCGACQAGLRLVARVRAGAILVTVLAVLGAAVALGRGAAPVSRTPLAAAAVAAGAAWLAARAHAWLPRFGFNDYVHADKD